MVGLPRVLRDRMTLERIGLNDFEPVDALRAVTHRFRVPFGVYNLRPVTSSTQPHTGVYRSALWWVASKQDLRQLDALGIRLMIDLRTSHVARNFPDPELAGIEQLCIDIHGDEDFVPSARGSAADMRAVMQQRYRNMVEVPGQRQRIAEVLRAIASQPAAVLFHCTDGKDRTGWIACLLQHIHGDSAETIRHDYLASNAEVAAMAQLRWKSLRARKGRSAADAHAPADVVADSYLDAALSSVKQHYGDLDGYLRDGLGLDAEVLDALRRKL